MAENIDEKLDEKLGEIDEKLKGIEAWYEKLFNKDFYENCYITIANDDIDGTILSANVEGMLWLVKTLIELCKERAPHSHRHLDEHSMIYECDKPLLIHFKDAPYDEQSMEDNQ